MNPARAPDEPFRTDINALRALAVLAVIAYHHGLPGARSGFIGVDIFFVISGYLVGGHVLRGISEGTFSLRAFYGSRVRRIVPALAVLCLAVIPWGWFHLLPRFFTSLVTAALDATLFISNLPFSQHQPYFDLGALDKPMLHTWSLSVEAQFYLALPFFLWGALALRRYAAWLLVAAGVASFGYALYCTGDPLNPGFYSAATRVWEFLAGTLVAWVLQRHGPWPWEAPRVCDAIWIAAWLGLIACCMFLPSFNAWPAKRTVIPVALTALIILAGAGRTAGAVAAHRTVQHAGTISYSLYLWHWPLLACWQLTVLPRDPSPLETAALLIATWLAGWASWRWVEQPARRSGSVLQWRRPLAAFGAVLLVAWSMSELLAPPDRFPARLPDYVQGAARAADDIGRTSVCRDGLDRLRHGEPVGCELGDAARPQPVFAMWGDSHARHYFESLDRAARLEHLRGQMFTGAGCRPTAPRPASSHPCDQHNQHVWDSLARTPSITTVVIAIRQNAPGQVPEGMAAARELLARNYRVIFLGPTPEATWTLPQEWAAEQLREGRATAGYSIARSARTHRLTLARDAATQFLDSYDDRLAEWQALVASEVPRHGGRLVAPDLAPLFCDAERCWLARDGVGLLRDQNHLTLAGADRVAPAVVKLLANR